MAKLQAKTESTNLADIVGAILDKGIVVDLWVKLLLLGTEILRLEARVVVASVETYLTYAEAIGLTRLVSAPATAAIGPSAVDIDVPATLDVAVHAVP